MQKRKLSRDVQTGNTVYVMFETQSPDAETQSLDAETETQSATYPFHPGKTLGDLCPGISE